MRTLLDLATTYEELTNSTRSNAAFGEDTSSFTVES
jgi:hypothetical protein